MAIQTREREVIVYYNEMVSLWQELDQCYNDEWDCPTDSVKIMKKEENDRVYMFFPGLNRDLDEVGARILGKKLLPSLLEVFYEIRREETRRKVMLNNSKPKPLTELENSTFISRSIESDGERRKKP